MSRLNDLKEEEWAKYNHTVWECASYNGYIASFDEDIPERLIKYFTFPGDNVLDPFVGSGTTLIAAKNLRRNSWGIDCSEKAVNITQRRLSQLRNSDITSKVIQGDSRRILKSFEEEKFDCIITSPPYFDIIKYSEDEEQLGNLQRYESFLEEVTKVFSESIRVLRKNKYFCIVTGDIRKRSQYFPLHVDYVNRLTKMGLRLHQILINVFETSGKGKREECMGYPSNFHPWMIHEYILIFQKDPQNL